MCERNKDGRWTSIFSAVLKEKVNWLYCDIENLFVVCSNFFLKCVVNHFVDDWCVEFKLNKIRRIINEYVNLVIIRNLIRYLSGVAKWVHTPNMMKGASDLHWSLHLLIIDNILQVVKPKEFLEFSELIEAWRLDYCHEHHPCPCCRDHILHHALSIYYIKFIKNILHLTMKIISTI